MGLTVSLHVISACHQKEINFCNLTACHVVEHTDVTRTISFLFYNSFCFLCPILFLLFWFISFCFCFPPPPPSPSLSSLYCSSLRHLLPFVQLFIASSTFSPASFLYSSLLFPPLLPLLIPPLSSSSDHLPKTKHIIFNRHNKWDVFWGILTVFRLGTTISRSPCNLKHRAHLHRVPTNVNLGQIQDEIKNVFSNLRTELRKKPNYMSQGVHAHGNGRCFLCSLLVLPEETPMLVSPGKVTLWTFIDFSIKFASVF